MAMRCLISSVKEPPIAALVLVLGAGAQPIIARAAKLSLMSKSIVVLTICLSLGVFAGDKVDAPQWTNDLKDLYIEDDKGIKTPLKADYSASPGAKMWRKVRSGNPYKTQDKGDDAAILINSKGEDWRQSKSQIAGISTTIIALALITPILLLLIFGQFKLKNGFSGDTVLRFLKIERIIHWGTAILFIILAISGLLLMLGKNLIIPLIGKDAFAVVAALSLDIHDFLGPVFSVFLVAMIIKFIKDNIYQKGDINWLKNAGGLFGKHADCWRFNLGEKAWFWVVFLAGLLISISGYIMLFTDLVAGQREIIEIMNLIHAISATLMIVGMFGHIYMGVAMQGSMTAMTCGKVDKNWAAEHHSLWYEKIK